MHEILILSEHADETNGAQRYLICSGDRPTVGVNLTLLEPTNPLEWKVSKVVPRPDGTFVLQLTGHRMLPHPQWRLTFDIALSAPLLRRRDAEPALVADPPRAVVSGAERAGP